MGLAWRRDAYSRHIEAPPRITNRRRSSRGRNPGSPERRHQTSIGPGMRLAGALLRRRLGEAPGHTPPFCGPILCIRLPLIVSRKRLARYPQQRATPCMHAAAAFDAGVAAGGGSVDGRGLAACARRG
ncbi:hypothetical protein MRX96_051350 [Rhipicephalus microplus]